MYIDTAVTAIAGFEGRVHWMYLDTEGNVTVGVGEELASPEAAIKFPFRRQTAELAETPEIIAEYALVKLMKPGLVASAYRRMSSLLLDDIAITQTLRFTVTEYAEELTKLFPLFPGFPDSAKVGLLDMQFNMGINRLRKDFPDFCNAVNSLRWPVAAMQCHRAAVSAARNAWTAEQFVKCGTF